jgi:TolB-like protein/Flp pilus assembly protein TadD
MSLIAELKRRNVFRVGVAYVICAWVIAQVADLVLDNIEAPDWVMQAIMLVLVIGFPLVLIFAWAFELTPEGIKRETTVDPAESITSKTGRKLDFAIIGLLALAVVYFAVDKFALQSKQEKPGVAIEPVEREKSIAVLPFDNISPDPEDAYFADGMHDEVLAQLSKIRDLKVISRTSVMGYRGDDRPSSPKIAGELSVANILEGSVRLAGNRVRITTQLIEAESDAHLWTETYDRELTAANIFSIQSEIAKIVADALRVTLLPEEQDRLVTVPTENIAAYEAYLHGKQRFAKLTSGSVKESVDYFQQAVELDPGFALAYVRLARAYVYLADWFGLPKNEMYSKAEVLIEKALRLDDQLGEAYTVLGQMQDWAFDSENAEAKFRRGLELNPNSAMTYFAYGGLMRELGRAEEALILHRKGVELDPLSAKMINEVGMDLDALGRFDEGLSWYEKSFNVDPGFSYSLWNIGSHYWWISGQYGEAVRWLRKAFSSDPSDLWNSAFLGKLFMDLGDADQAERWIHQSIELNPEGVISNQAMCLFHFYRDDQATGLEYGRIALADRLFGWGLKVYPVQLIGNHELRAGRTAESRAVYKKSHPELLVEGTPRVNNWNYRVAIDLALVLFKTGEKDQADLLLELASQHIETLPRLSVFGHWIDDVKIYALQGDKQNALLALRQAIDEGWRSLWWYYLKQDPTLESLHDEPEFQAMVAEIEADMAAQLARVREMERNGELEPIPEISATTH